MNYLWLNKTTKFILISFIFIVAILHLLRGIQDLDFFWHLKTGEWIWQNKSLPSIDPFAYTTPQIHSSREHFVLTSYWLSQLIYYLLYLADGFTAIVFLRFLIVGSLIYIMLKRKQGDGILYMSLLVLFLTQFLEAYNIDRPQSFSFLFFAMLLYILEKIKNEPEIKMTNLLIIPLLMLIWANMHGGHILGQITIVLYIGMEGIKFIHPSLRPIEKIAYKRLLIAGFLGVLFSFANPNTYHSSEEFMSIPSVLHRTMENFSSVEFLKIYGDYSILLFWFIMSLTLLGLILNFRKIDITEVALIIGTGYFSFTTTRYISFFMIASLPVVNRSFTRDNILKLTRVLVIFAAFYFAVFFTWGERLNINRITTGEWNNVPLEDVVRFILDNDIKGNMYNHYGFGGYLIWRLAPERKVFIDGRNLYEHVLMQSAFVNIAFTKDIDGLPTWKHILERYRVNYVIMPLFEIGGIPFPLIYALLQDSDWIPVFFNPDSRIIIFVKNSPENYRVISRYAIPKYYFLAKIPKVKMH